MPGSLGMQVSVVDEGIMGAALLAVQLDLLDMGGKGVVEHFQHEHHRLHFRRFCLNHGVCDLPLCETLKLAAHHLLELVAGKLAQLVAERAILCDDVPIILHHVDRNSGRQLLDAVAELKEVEPAALVFVEHEVGVTDLCCQIVVVVELGNVLHEWVKNARDARGMRLQLLFVQSFFEFGFFLRCQAAPRLSFVQTRTRADSHSNERGKRPPTRTDERRQSWELPGNLPVTDEMNSSSKTATTMLIKTI